MKIKDRIIIQTIISGQTHQTLHHKKKSNNTQKEDHQCRTKNHMIVMIPHKTKIFFVTSIQE